MCICVRYQCHMTEKRQRKRVEVTCRPLTPRMLTLDVRKWSSDRLWLLWLEIWHERDPSTPSQQIPARRQENKRDWYLPRPEVQAGATCFPILGLYIMKSNGFGVWGLLYSYKCTIIITVSAKITDTTVLKKVLLQLLLLAHTDIKRGIPNPTEKKFKRNFIHTGFWVFFLRMY